MAWRSADAAVKKAMEAGKPTSLGSHVKHRKGCGEVAAIHFKGKHGDMEASDDNPVAEIDSHDDKCMKTGKMIHLRLKSLESADGPNPAANPEETPETKDKCMNEGSGAAGGSTVAPKEGTKDDDMDMGDGGVEETEEALDDETEGGGFKAGDHVNIKAPHYKGFGRVRGVYKRGHVPHVPNDIMGTKDDPAARVECYKAMGDGFAPTDDHIAVKCAHLTKRSLPMTPPTKGKRPPTETSQKTKRTEPLVEPLPPIVAKSDQEVRAEMIARLNEMLSPEGFRKIAREEAARAAGHV